MPAPLPSALRARFEEYIAEGLSGRAAAARLKLSAATGVRWKRKLHETGAIEPAPRGRPRGHGKLAPHQAFLEELLAQDGDITLSELAGALEAATGVAAHAASIGRFLRKLGYTRSHGRPEILWVDADVCADSCKRMIRAGFLSPSERRKLEACVRSHRAGHGVARRANAILLLDDGKSCQAIAEFLYLDDDTIRGWYRGGPSFSTILQPC